MNIPVRTPQLSSSESTYRQQRMTRHVGIYYLSETRIQFSVTFHDSLEQSMILTINASHTRDWNQRRAELNFRTLVFALETASLTLQRERERESTHRLL